MANEFKQTTQTNSRFYLEYYDYEFVYGETSRVYMPLPHEELDMEKCLKKWYRHVSKKLRNTSISVDAMAEAEDDDGYRNYSMKWGYDYMMHDPELPFC